MFKFDKQMSSDILNNMYVWDVSLWDKRGNIRHVTPLSIAQMFSHNETYEVL
jgi:hypothetical protein